MVKKNFRKNDNYCQKKGWHWLSERLTMNVRNDDNFYDKWWQLLSERLAMIVWNSDNHYEKLWKLLSEIGKMLFRNSDWLSEMVTIIIRMATMIVRNGDNNCQK